MENMIVIHGQIDYIYCHVCGRKVRGDLCYTCGNNDLPNFVIPSKIEKPVKSGNMVVMKEVNRNA